MPVQFPHLRSCANRRGFLIWKIASGAYTILWLLALSFMWVNWGSWSTWFKVLAILLFIFTTPALGDLMESYEDYRVMCGAEASENEQ